MTLTKSQKVIILFSIAWAVVCLLIAGDEASNSYNEHFSIVGFFTISLILSSPILLYWAGVWIWGFNYIIRIIKFPFTLFTTTGMHKLPNRLLRIPKIIFAFIVALIVVLIIFYITNQTVISIVKPSGALGMGVNTLETLEALANILGIVFGIKLALKSYKWLIEYSTKIKEEDKLAL